VKKTCITFLFLLLFATQAFADFFQFVYKDGGSEWYVTVSQILVYDSNNRKLFSGNTDRFGRIQVVLAKGTYRCVILYNKKSFTINITIDQSTKLKKITVNPIYSIMRRKQ
jgi:hypothetical protein